MWVLLLLVTYVVYIQFTYVSIRYRLHIINSTTSIESQCIKFTKLRRHQSLPYVTSHDS